MMHIISHLYLQMVYDICTCRCTQQLSRAWHLRALAVSCSILLVWMLLARAFGSSIVHKRRLRNFSEAEHAEHPTNSCFGFSPAQFLPPGQKLIAYRLYREERASFGSCLNPFVLHKVGFPKVWNLTMNEQKMNIVIYIRLLSNTVLQHITCSFVFVLGWYQACTELAGGHFKALLSCGWLWKSDERQRMSCREL